MSGQRYQRPQRKVASGAFRHRGHPPEHIGYERPTSCHTSALKPMSTRERERALHYQRRQKFDRELQSRGAEYSKFTHIRRQAYEKLAHTAGLHLERLVVEQQKEFAD